MFSQWPDPGQCRFIFLREGERWGWVSEGLLSFGVQGHFEKKRLFLEHFLCRIRFDETDSVRRNVSVTNLETSFDRGGLYVECFFWWGEN